ncbi:hypothetical protein G647_07802 [Cladophialophora carrionii CBS 160.54]|uniref:FHA domain-containing protein n=1 Tax=Cladophialophora carrionii CBS 160.54 TaxID=1279043 RepID=V9D3L6_9EURO|nr:uncharacterized protein G647_07802 [Cladophialophora carrionii CBS 160.54]ETI21455.1 hypothetical protein G647_07802 [Cladophialophora carrionii CBS 160.54]
MISPPAAVSSPAAGDPSVTRTTSARRRGLSYLRALSHNRSSGGTSPNEPPSRSPRHYFQRSLSYNDNRPDPTTTRRRSISRPNEPTIPLSPDLRQIDTRSPSPRIAPAAPVLDAPVDQVEQDTTDEMARHRNSMSRRNASNSRPADTLNATASEAAPRPMNPRNTSKSGTQDGETKQHLPTIRFFPHQEIRNGRPSLNFTPIARTLPSEHSIIRVGRYSEREGVPSSNPTGPSDAPVGFKSKVVSRRHCEFSFLDGQWQIKDVASSSGTFLNHIRLSQPNTESRLFPIKDGDIVQLGIDFRGGEEMIFRCVKIRIECNRAWQKKANNFNKARHQQLQSLAKDQPSADANSGECSICLGSVLPCQALFVAPCAHVWHYKCIRPLLEGKNSVYPQFQCPNCRAYSDLTADVDLAQSDIDEWMDNTDDPENQATEANAERTNEPNATSTEHMNGPLTGGLAADNSPSTADSQANQDTLSIPENAPVAVTQPEIITDGNASSPLPIRTPGLLARRQATNPASPELSTMNGNIDMPDRADETELGGQLEHQRTNTQTPDPAEIIAGEGPLTPRNNAGPFVFDGSAGRSDARHLLVPSVAQVADGK